MYNTQVCNHTLLLTLMSNLIHLYRLTNTWKEAMESSCFYHRVDLKSIIISDDIKMSHTAAVWKEAVGLLWPKENQQ